MGDPDRARLKAYGISLAVFLVDRLTKWIVESRMSLMDVHQVIPGFFDIVHAKNKGIAFSMFNDSTSPFRSALLILLPVAAIVLMAVLIWRGAGLNPLTRLALALVLGGALGNVFDRAAFGQVTDFLDVYYRDWHWPAFNVADSGVSVGGVLLLIDAFLPQRKPHAA